MGADAAQAAFVDEVWMHLGLEGDPIRDGGASVYDDWGLDSLQTFQLLVTIEAMADVNVPPVHIPEIMTVDDAYAYFTSLCAQTDDERRLA